MFEKKYFVRNKILYFILIFVNWVTLPINFFKKKPTDQYHTDNILVANNGHYGDIILLTSAVNVLKKQYPDLKIGLITGSWNQKLLEIINIFDDVYFVDHWKVNRSSTPFWNKLWRYWKSFWNTYNQLSKAHYSVAIDTYHFFPNHALLLFLSRLSVRIGYRSGGFENFYTNFIIWKPKNQNIADYHVEIFKTYFKNLPQISPFLKPFQDSVLPADKIVNGNYIILHPGAGDHIKFWNIDSWQVLIKILSPRYDNIVITGIGTEEVQIAKKLMVSDKVLNYTNFLSLDEFSALLKDAQAIICLDSFAAHFAAQYNLKTFILSTAINNPYWWKPIHTNCFLISHSIDCAPCNFSHGCSSMSCIRDIHASEVNNLLISQNV